METLFFIILGVYGLFAVLFGIRWAEEEPIVNNYSIIKKERKKEIISYIKVSNILFLISGVVCVSISMTLTGLSIDKSNPPDVKSSKFEVKTEIRQELLNGQEISRDTVYIFTPKKKEK